MKPGSARVELVASAAGGRLSGRTVKVLEAERCCPNLRSPCGRGQWAASHFLRSATEAKSTEARPSLSSWSKESSRMPASALRSKGPKRLRNRSEERRVGKE